MTNVAVLIRVATNRRARCNDSQIKLPMFDKDFAVQ
jgi:hypothetical protein